MQTNLMCVNAYTYDHELGHAIDIISGTTEPSTRDNLLIDHRQPRRDLFADAKAQGTLISAYAGTNTSENTAEDWSLGIMLDTDGRLNTLINYAKNGKFESLRIYLSLLDILIFNTPTQNYLPVYKGAGSVGALNVETDSDHYMTKIFLPDKTVTFEYDEQKLRIRNMWVDSVMYHNNLAAEPVAAGVPAGGLMPYLAEEPIGHNHEHFHDELPNEEIDLMEINHLDKKQESTVRASKSNFVESYLPAANRNSFPEKMRKIDSVPLVKKSLRVKSSDTDTKLQKWLNNLSMWWTDKQSVKIGQQDNLNQSSSSIPNPEDETK